MSELRSPAYFFQPSDMWFMFLLGLLVGFTAGVLV